MTSRTFCARGWADDRGRRVGRRRRPGAGAAFRTPWGDPDIQGIFTTDDELGVPFERPEQFAGARDRHRQGVRRREAQAQRQADVDAEEFVAPRAAGTGRRRHRPAGALARARQALAAHVDRHRSARRDDSVSERRGAQARGERRERADDRQSSVRRPGRARPVRPLHHARPAARHLPDHLQQHVADRAGPGLRRDPLRDDSRRAHHPARRPAAALVRRSGSTSATRAAAGKATRWSSTSRTSRRT